MTVSATLKVNKTLLFILLLISIISNYANISTCVNRNKQDLVLPTQYLVTLGHSLVAYWPLGGLIQLYLYLDRTTLASHLSVFYLSSSIWVCLSLPGPSFANAEQPVATGLQCMMTSGQWRRHTRYLGCVRTPCKENIIFVPDFWVI